MKKQKDLSGELLAMLKDLVLAVNGHGHIAIKDLEPFYHKPMKKAVALIEKVEKTK